jgi:hypothetical protein
MKPGLCDMTSADYRAFDAINQSSLKKWIELGMEAGNPAKYRAAMAAERAPSDAMVLGSVVDCLAITPARFSAEFVVVPEESPARPSERSRNAKKPSPATLEAIAFWDKFDAEAAGKQIVKAEMLEQAWAMLAALKANPDIASIFSTTGKRVAIAEMHGVRCKAEFDLFSEKSGWLFDLKTCGDASNTERGFGSAIANFGYDLQAAFYLDMAAACGSPKEGFAWVAVESSAPHFVNVITMTADDVRIHSARERYLAALTSLVAHKSQNNWPGYFCFEEAVTPAWHTIRAAKARVEERLAA